ncbi:MAG: tRNA uridine-5-carboxymethylaminomethyl(34) synthesis enzyme MnmG, partial [Thermodesulfobacteriota bacterium]
LEEYPEDILSEAETEIKYSGYIQKQLKEIEKFKKLESMKLPEDLNYYEIPGLSNEMKEKFSKIRPNSIGQAMRIPGVTPAAISAIQIYLKKRGFHIKEAHT